MAESNPTNASILANLNIMDSIKKCNLVEYSNLFPFLPNSLNSSHSLPNASSYVSVNPSTVTTAPNLLIAIIMKETEGFLADMEIADAQIQLQNKSKFECDPNLPAEIRSITFGDDVLNDAFITKIQEGDTDILNTSNNAVLNDRRVKGGIPSPQISQSPLSPSCLYDVGFLHNKIEDNIAFFNEEKKAEVEAEVEVKEKGDRMKDELETKEYQKKMTVGDTCNGSEVKSEKLPLAELILASHATLLLHTVYSSMSPSLGVNTNKKDRGHHDIFSESSSESQSNEFGNYEGSLVEELVKKEGGTGKKQREERGVDILLPKIISSAAVRSGLPHKSWWLPIRVLKGFLVLQEQVIFILFYFILHYFNPC